MIKLLLNIAKVINYSCAICKDYVSIYIKYYLFILKYLQMLQEKKVNILKIQSYNNKKKILLLK